MSTIKVPTKQIIAEVDGEFALLRVVVPVLGDLRPGWPEIINRDDELVVRFVDIDNMRAMADALYAAADHANAMFTQAAEPVVTVQDDGAIAVQAGWLRVLRVPDDRTIINGRPFLPLRISTYKWNAEMGRQTIGVPVGMTLREVVRQTEDSVLYRESVPRLFRLLVAAEREARRTVAA